ncbi:MAG TPA: family 10 glycosylhydrolase [Nocardioidaceae bacterium]|nr:family 10 glycosylhydrolase [Nocardioidaceae bacterium]
MSAHKIIGLGLALAASLLATQAPASSAPRISSGPAPAATAVRSACTVSRLAPKRQLRGEWIATVNNVDWPSKPGLTPDEQRAELVSWLDEAKSRGLNAVVLQVRPTADTFWPSRIEPWSRFLTGVAGQDPGYDPLAFAVRAAHKRNLELHAWFNPFRVAMNTNRAELPPDSPASQHPDWVVAYGGRLSYDPGLPQVRDLVRSVVMEVVRRYDVDAVHFDDYFYPYPTTKPFPDDASFAAYGDGFTDRAAWRRHNIDLLISTLNRRIHRAKPWVKFGVSPFAVWRNASTDPVGSPTSAGIETYDDQYADTRLWVRRGWLDYIAPQVYWNLGYPPADYAKVVPWWTAQVRGTDVQLYVGQAAYKVGTSTQDPAWSDPGEMSRHLAFDSRHPSVRGDLYFSAKDVRADRLGFMDLVQHRYYAHPALVPQTPGVPGRAPARVTGLRAVRLDRAVRLSWQGHGASYAVYRFAHSQISGCDLADADHLVATVHAVAGTSSQRFVDAHAPTRWRPTYVVTALDRAYRESRPAQVTVRR